MGRGEVETVRLAARRASEMGPTRLLYHRQTRPGYIQEALALGRLPGLWRIPGFVLALLFQVVERVVRLSRRPAEGCIDFGKRQYFYQGPGGIKDYYVNQTKYLGFPRTWYHDSQQSSGASPPEEPLWLVELLLGAVEADTTTQGRASDNWTGYRVLCDARLAVEASTYGMARPSTYRLENLSRIAVGVWLDEDGNIRREELETHWLQVTLELSDHGRTSEECFPPLPTVTEELPDGL